MNKAINSIRIGAAAAMLLLVISGLITVAGVALAEPGARQASTSAALLAANDAAASPRLQAATDPRVLAVKPIQSVEDSPLILNKSTVVRVLVGSVATTTDTIDISVAVDFDGQQMEQTATLTTTEQYVDFYPAAPTELRTINVSATITPGEGFDDDDPSNNTMEVSVPTIRMPDTLVKIFYLPVDWTAEAREIGEFSTYFPAYVKENTDFVRAAYPMPDAQVVAESTNVPHMLTERERQLADSRYNFNPEGMILFGGSVVLTARQYSPDAELVAAVLPPHWLQQNYDRSALGFASSQFPGTTFVLLWGPQTMVIGHEYGHLRNLIDDYDFGGERVVRGYLVDRQGFWVAHKTPVANRSDFEVYNMMSSAVYNGDYNHFWIDSRSYDHLTANYISAGGEASEPLVIAATVADRVNEDGVPLFAAAGQNYWDPKAKVGLSVATIGTSKSDKIRVVWKHGDRVMDEQEQAAPGPGFAYTRFSYRASGDGMAIGRYDVETYLNDKLVKTSRFFSEPTWVPQFNIALGDNTPDRSSGYRAGVGVSSLRQTQESMFINFASTRQQTLYAWFVGVADGTSESRDLDVDLKFIGPDGKEYQSTWIDDGKVTAGQTLDNASYARKALNIAGTDAAAQLGAWNVQVLVDGQQVATSTFTLLDQAAGSADDAAADALDALGYRLIRVQPTASLTSTEASRVLMSMEPINGDLKSPEFIQQVWDGFRVVSTLYPNYGVYRLRLPLDPRYQLILNLQNSDWAQIANDPPSWDTLRDQASFKVEVQDDIKFAFLSAEDAVAFLEDRLR